ncbi:MAG: SGNH/GDSL hydrolase family protein [Verrucomicrobiaceae bacterium]|nr:SGNH/GDSL hydrolase family protein [Verrucomicrobiaceae bacterium]
MKNFNRLLLTAVCALSGLVPCVHAQQKKKTADAPAAKKSGASPDDKQAQQSEPAPRTGEKTQPRGNSDAGIPDGRPAAADSDAATPTAPKHTSFDLKADQVERFRKLLPKSFVKLTNRDRFHIVAIGDADVEAGLHDATDEDLLKTTAGSFAKELAMQFYYTGGVRVVRPAPTKAKKAKDGKVVTQLGPEITVRLLRRDDKMMIHAMQSVTTHGAENQPDLVIVGFGVNDALNGLDAGAFAKSLQEVITTVRARGAELVLLGPTLTTTDPAEESLGTTRAYADTMRDVAADSGVFFMDGGDLAPLVAVSADVKEPEQIFDQVVKQYRRFFDPADLVHPRAEIYRSIGKRIFTELTSGPDASPWSIEGGAAVFESPDKFALTYEIKNKSDEERTFVALPLVSHEWKPMDAAPEITLKAGETRPVKASYARRPGASGGLPAHEPLLRLPVLVSGGGSTRVEVVRATVSPFAFLWKLATLFNQESAFTLENLLINTTATPLDGTWSAEWLGQKRNGQFSLAAGEKKPLGVSFELPAAPDPWRQTSPLTMEVNAGGLKMRFDRTIEISRNLGLRQTVPLTPLSEPDKAPGPSATPGVRLRIDADANSLFLTYEMNGFNIEDRGAGRGAFGCQLALDARSYGKRLGFGAVEALQLYGRAADGDYVFENPQPWAFGTGYSATYDPQYIRGLLSSTGSGARRFTITLPRSYLYMHEWAIGNGNSQLGIRTTLAFWKGPRDGVPEGDYPHDLAFSLVANGRHPDDAEGLAVLELTDRPTSRWTVNPF